jgi:hypothetical protein
MTRSISEMLSSFKKDIARQSRFDVSITLPAVLFDKKLINYSDERLLTLRCDAAEFPGKTFATVEQKFGTNPIEKYPYQVAHDDISLTFIISGDMQEKIIFDSWMKLIMPYNDFNPTYKYTGLVPNYVSEVTISQYNVTGDRVYENTLVDAYPISVNQLELDWSSDNFHKLTVLFAYTYWKSPTYNLLVNK